MSIAHGQRVLAAGEPVASARAAMILLHGRGASAEDIMTIASEVQHPGWAYLAPQAVGNAWYPNPFTAPLESNEPYLSAALDMISKLVERVEPTVPAQRIMLLGFSQGACLTLEWAARNARRYGAIVGLSGGLIGPDDTPRDYPGSFDQTPVFLGCSDVDPYIAKERVLEAADVSKRMGGVVTVRLYPGMGHMVGPEELAIVRGLVESI
jgi:phospholipase/carboxylesterase/glyoxalase family protein